MLSETNIHIHNDDRNHIKVELVEDDADPEKPHFNRCETKEQSRNKETG
jgi:hypothetical protein